MGVTKRESAKFIFTHSYLMTSISFALASIELTVVNLISSFKLNNNQDIFDCLKINPFSYILMLVVSLLIATLSSLIISKKIVKTETLELIK